MLFRLVNMWESESKLCLMKASVSQLRFGRTAVTLIALAALVMEPACSRKPPQIAYLGPLDRVQEGFLDPETYQIVSYGRALDLSKQMDPRSTYFPRSIDYHFDQEEFKTYNVEQAKLFSERKPTTGFPMFEIMEAEANQLNPQEVNLSLIDEKIRGPMEIKRALFDNACMHARIQGLFRMLIAETMQMKLIYGATVPQEGIPISGLTPIYYPPREYYVAESTAILKDLEKVLQKRKFRYEIVQEVFSKPELLECKMTIHIHRKNLQLTMPYLSPL
jgi:hypothetical protein